MSSTTAKSFQGFVVAAILGNLSGSMFRAYPTRRAVVVKQSGPTELPRTEIDPIERSYAPEEARLLLLGLLGLLGLLHAGAARIFISEASPTRVLIAKAGSAGIFAALGQLHRRRCRQITCRRIHRMGGQRCNNETDRSKERITNQRLHDLNLTGWQSQWY